MPKAKTLDQIKLNLLRPALTSHFEVEIPIPPNIKNIFASAKRPITDLDETKLRLSCSEVSLPGSSLATLEINNDFTGVTERHAHRRIYDDRIDLTFYVDAEKYLPIVIFESWIKYIAGEQIAVDEQMRGNVGAKDKNYFYRVRFPDEYVTDRGLKVIKFERDYNSSVTYEFIRSYPISITSMPISYESSNLLKCTVSMTYIRYVVTDTRGNPFPEKNQISTTPTQQAYFNSANQIFQNPTFAYGGVPDFAASASGNSAYDSNSTSPQSTLGQIYRDV